MEFDGHDNIIYVSVQDLLQFYKEETGNDDSHLNVYQLTIFFLERHPHDLFMVDEVPLIKDGKFNQPNQSIHIFKIANYFFTVAG